MQDKAAAKHNPNVIAALVGTQSFFRGYERIFAIYAQIWRGFETKVFSTVSEARAWVANIFPSLV
jgi:hypothetical protein